MGFRKSSSLANVSGVGGGIKMEGGSVKGSVNFRGFEGNSVGITHGIINLNAIYLGTWQENFEIDSVIGKGGVFWDEPKRDSRTIDFFHGDREIVFNAPLSRKEGQRRGELARRQVLSAILTVDGFP